MDARRFDALTRALSSPSRRGLLSLFGTLPVLGALLTILATDDAEAKGRRKRRKKRHKHGQGPPKNRKGKRKGTCRRKSRAKICANRCGVVKNRKTCQKKIDCGTCGVPGEECQAGVCVQTCTLQPDADLQMAIEATPVGGTLILCAGTWNLSAPVRIARDLTLGGVGAERTVLQGPGTDRVLQIAGEIAVTLQNLGVTGGAGGIVNAGNLVLRAVAVTGNSTTSGGGGIYNVGPLTLADGSRIAGNRAGIGGGIRNDGGTVILQEHSVVGGDVAADANVATTSGGGIFNDGGAVILQAGSRVAGNRASDDGGGIVNVSNSTLTLENGSRVTGNTATDLGGGILNLSNEPVTVPADAYVCNNSTPQCAGSGGFTGDCPNPESEVCPPE